MESCGRVITSFTLYYAIFALFASVSDFSRLKFPSLTCNFLVDLFEVEYRPGST